MLDERSVRLGKLEALRAQGIEPYPQESHRSHLCGDVTADFGTFEASKTMVTLAGRVMSIRVHGGLLFADLRDGSGSLQLVFKEDEIADEFARFRDAVDPGDFVEATGTAFTTKRGEKSIEVGKWAMLAKALLPLPEKWHGLADIETRFRHRELDLLSSPEVRERFIVRSKLISSLRAFLDKQDFMEIETPMLQPIPGGANAKPFITHHNALDIDLYLRIAPELYLKRMIVGGFERIFEIGRCFRNEGIDHSHNPEFTMLELYWAYAGKDEFLAFIEQMLSTIVKTALGKEFGAPFPRLTFRQAVLDATGIDVDELKNEKDVINAVKANKLKVDFKNRVGLGEYLDELYKKTARSKITGPAWVLDYPVEMMPLAGRSPEDPNKSAIAQLIISGTEVVKCFYHELNDPLDQRERFKAEEALSQKGSEDAQRLDTAFLDSLEHGMPPTAGMGMGIDRLTAILTESPSLKEVILFPTLRPEAE